MCAQAASMSSACAHPPGLEHAASPQPTDGAQQVFLAVDGGVRGHGNLERLKQRFFLQPILRDFERLARRTDDGRLLERRESGTRNVLPVECDYIAALSQFHELGGILEVAHQDGRHLRAGSIGAAVEEEAGEAQWIPR